jgi:DNA-binding beta-propeller fold protein YncE
VGLLVAGCSRSTSPSDNEPPVPGNAGLIIFLAVQPTSCTLLWSPAADNKDDSGYLEYSLIRSTSANIADVAAAEANGELIRDWVSGATAAVDTGLTAGTTYYYNVLTRDQAENVSAYVMVSRTMPLEADETDPVPGGSGLISFTNVTPTTISLSWAAASDDRSAQADLRYQLVRSTSPEIATLLDVETFGAVIFGYNWEANVSAAIDTGLIPETDYYYNLLVRDEAGNTVAYGMVSEPTIPTDKLYFADTGGGQIRVVDLFFGESYVVAETGTSLPVGIAVDEANRMLYASAAGLDQVYSIGLDEPHQWGLTYPTDSLPAGVAIDPTGNYLYWASGGDASIGRSSITTALPEVLVSTGLTEPFGLALDVAGGKMYWADFGASKIQRANLDGTAVEDLATSLLGPAGIDLAPQAGKIYWVEMGSRSIRRANLDGSNVEDVMTVVVGSPTGIAVDEINGKLYFTDNSAFAVRRANLDGTNLENVWTVGISHGSLIDLAIYTWTGGGQ